jgi:hypothetical protein
MPRRDAFRPGQLSGPSTAIIVVVVELHRDGLSLLLLAALPSWVPCRAISIVVIGLLAVSESSFLLLLARVLSDVRLLFFLP